MWNVIVDEDRAWLIDWDEPRVRDPAMEVALLDKHAWLFNGRGLDPAFFAGYGARPAEPNTSLHRVVQAVRWVASEDWDSFEATRRRPSCAHARAAGWPRWLATVRPDAQDRAPARADRLALAGLADEEPARPFRTR